MDSSYASPWATLELSQGTHRAAGLTNRLSLQGFDPRSLDYSMLGATIAKHMQLGPGRLRGLVERLRFNDVATDHGLFGGRSGHCRTTRRRHDTWLCARSDGAVPGGRPTFSRRHADRVRRRRSDGDPLSGWLPVDNLGHTDQPVREGDSLYFEARQASGGQREPGSPGGEPRSRTSAGRHSCHGAAWREPSRSLARPPMGSQRRTGLVGRLLSPAGRSHAGAWRLARQVAHGASGPNGGGGEDGRRSDVHPFGSHALLGTRCFTADARACVS